MYKLNVDGIKWFRKVEMLTFWMFVFICILDNILRGIFVYIYIDKYFDDSKSHSAYTFLTISEWLPVILLIFSFAPLIITLKRYYYFEYNRIKVSMLFFFSAELSIFIFLRICDFL